MLAQNFDMTGLDVSETAVRRAQELHPGIPFLRGDITAEGFVPPGEFHFVILAQCWWYVLHELSLTLNNLASCIRPGGFFVLSQAFLKEQRYAKDIADGFDGALRLLMAIPGLRLVEAHYDDTGLLCYHDGLIIMRRFV
jgi:SAM-dependent methyltransferase